MSCIFCVRAVIGCMTNSQPKQCMMSVFCHLSKAFDVIDHKIMLAKLEYYGFRAIVKKMIIRLFCQTEFSLLNLKIINQIHAILSVESLKGQYWDHFFI